MEPSTGGIRALVGGSNFRTSQFDRTRRMERQPGSAAKPFVYAAAFEWGGITPASIIDDAPVEIRLASNKVWRPRNYDQQYRGPVTVREAFEKSLNVPAIRLAADIGVGRVQEVLEDAGFGSDLSDTPAIALGVDDVSMRQLVAAYSIFPNLGVRTEPHLIENIVTRDGASIYTYEVQTTPVLTPAVAYVVHSLMRGVVQHGTGARLNQYGLGYIAGKTGTTNNYRDAWFIGYTPDLLTAVWVGFDDGRPLRVSSAEAAVPMWAEFMRRVPHTRGEIRPPEGVSVLAIEAGTGTIWRPGCGLQVMEVFIAGTEPRVECSGAFDPTLVMLQFEEPPMITEEQWAEWSREAYGLRDVQVVDDPEAIDMAEGADTLEISAELDSLELEDSTRLEEQKRRDSIPVPVVVPPVIKPPVAPPPPPPPTDSLDPGFLDWPRSRP